MARIDTLDLEFQGTANVIAAFLIHGPTGPVLVETGPGSTLPGLLEQLAARDVQPGDIRDVVVTHIHLDHAGAAGWWAQQGARVWVHEIGAPHLIDPSKLLSSAERIYGDAMETLWGEILPAPRDQVITVADQSVLHVGGLELKAVETQGHAWHHHVFQLGDVVFSGDAAGILLPASEWIDLPAPPPEFNLEVWKKSLERLRQLGAQRLYRTHFGPGGEGSTSVNAELHRFECVLDQAAAWMRELVESELRRGEMVAEFGKRMRAAANESGIDDPVARQYELANPRSMSVDGIARYWRKRLDS